MRPAPQPRLTVEEVGVVLTGQAVEVENAQQVVKPAGRGHVGRGPAVAQTESHLQRWHETHPHRAPPHWSASPGGSTHALPQAWYACRGTRAQLTLPIRRGPGVGDASSQGDTHWPCVSPHTVSSVPWGMATSTREGSDLRIACACRRGPQWARGRCSGLLPQLADQRWVCQIGRNNAVPGGAGRA